jgi:hypothetical protein
LRLELASPLVLAREPGREATQKLAGIFRDLGVIGVSRGVKERFDLIVA